jgi:hypothetical protein
LAAQKLSSDQLQAQKKPLVVQALPVQVQLALVQVHRGQALR